MKPANDYGLNPALKVATGFLILFLCAGIFMGVGRSISEIGFTPETVRSYYLGSEEAMTYPKEFPELMESTHVHFFMIPVIYYLLCYFFAQIGTASRWKTVLVGLTFANIAGFLTAPFLIRYTSLHFERVLPVLYLIFICSAGVLTINPLRELLKSRTRGQERE